MTPFEKLLADVIPEYDSTEATIAAILDAMKDRRITVIASDDVVRFKVTYPCAGDPRDAAEDFAEKFRGFILENNMVKAVAAMDRSAFTMFADLILPGYAKQAREQQGQA
jgi:hypothetical protein